MDNNEYVSKEEFYDLKNKVDKLQKELDDSIMVLNKIDKKVDGILIKLEDKDTISDLKLAPVNDKIKQVDDRVTTIEDNNKWLWRTILGVVVGLVINLIWKMLK